MGSATSLHHHHHRHRCCCCDDEEDDALNEVTVASPWQMKAGGTDAIERLKQTQPLLLLLPTKKRRPKCVQWSGSPSFSSFSFFPLFLLLLLPSLRVRARERRRRGRGKKGGSFVPPARACTQVDTRGEGGRERGRKAHTNLCVGGFERRIVFAAQRAAAVGVV